MEGYAMKYRLLGENLQTIRKARGMKQQELADQIGINMQSLSKIERGLNYPTFETLEKIMNALGITPNELLSGEWSHTDHAEPFLIDVIRREADFDVSLDTLHENEYFQSHEQWQYYMKDKLAEYIGNYLDDTKTSIEELLELKQLVQRQKTERLLKMYKELHSLDRYGEQLQGYVYDNPYDDEQLRELADIGRKRNIPDVSPQSDFDEEDYKHYLEEIGFAKPRR